VKLVSQFLDLVNSVRAPPFQETRWVSNWVVTPIFLLGYRPATFDFPPPTQREGPIDRMWLMVEHVSLGKSTR
jgi:hypothetical protein